MSFVVPVTDDNDAQYKVEVSGPRALVAELKAKYVAMAPGTKGKMLSFFCHGVEMEDNRSVVVYYHGHGSHVSVVEVPHQPFAPVDYEKMNQSLIADGYPKDTELPYNAETWNTKWNKGNEWEKYPPVDVNNIWTTIPPSSSRELTRSGSAAENGVPQGSPQSRRKANSVNEEEGDPSRRLIPEYHCRVRGFRFERFYKMEGKWNGEARVVDLSGHLKGESKQRNGPMHGVHKVHISSSQLFYIPSSRSWGELQHITSPDGVMSSHRMAYTPVSNGVLMVETDQQALSQCAIRLREQEDANTVLLTAVDRTSGQPIVIETITCSNDFNSRTRTTQHFDDNGNIVAVYVFTEKKILDSESGAITPYTIGSPKKAQQNSSPTPPPMGL